jgi:hypothetical protein
VTQGYAIYREIKSNPVTQNHFLAMNQSKCVKMVDRYFFHCCGVPVFHLFVNLYLIYVHVSELLMQSEINK